MNRPVERGAIDGRIEGVRAALAAQAGAPSVIVVTSAMETDGKGALAECLAHSLVLAGRRVLLVDANPGPPSLTRSSAPQLSAAPEFDILAFAIAARGGLPGLLSLTGPQIFETCTPQAARAAFGRFRAAYEYAIVDAAIPASGSAALVLAAAADRVLLAVRLGRRASRHDRRLAELLESGGASVLGVVTMQRRTIEAYGAKRSAPLGPFPISTFTWGAQLEAGSG